MWFIVFIAPAHGRGDNRNMIDASRYPRLSRIDRPADLRTFEPTELRAIADELRTYLIESVGKSAGHFGAGLGVDLRGEGHASGVHDGVRSGVAGLVAAVARTRGVTKAAASQGSSSGGEGCEMLCRPPKPA